CQQYTGSPCSF
nr:immunoglobulin light chain junction region [Macaca mulatta]MOW40493.1 immunoglobulin light chain junction region [Macaca mulatta]